MEPLIGTPRKRVSQWLDEYADDNEIARQESLMPWARVKYKAQAGAFRTAADMVRRAHSDNDGAKHFPVSVAPRSEVSFAVTFSSDGPADNIKA